MEGLPYANQSIQVNRGDRLFLYTDGVTEAFDPDRNMFGVERLYSLLEQLRTMPLQEVPAQVLAQVIAFERGGEQTDDITCLVASFDPPDSRES
jgi:sigma-B regulation protein RsbU (phosphoserine phosphatase)